MYGSSRSKYAYAEHDSTRIGESMYPYGYIRTMRLVPYHRIATVHGLRCDVHFIARPHWGASLVNQLNPAWPGRESQKTKWSPSQYLAPPHANEPKMNSEGNVNSVEDERALLRRNQRNSRARKQAYVQDLEKRWKECVRLGAQASVEMQREARRVQEENKLLRALLHKQGLDDTAIQRGIVALAKSEENEIQSPPLVRPSEIFLDASVDPASLSVRNNAWPDGLQSDPQALPRSLNFVGGIPQDPSTDDWFTDLCGIKDASTVDLLACVLPTQDPQSCT